MEIPVFVYPASPKTKIRLCANNLVWGKQAEKRVLEYLRAKGQPVPYRIVHRNLNFSSGELEGLIEPLIKVGLIKNHYRGKERMLEAV